MCYFKVEKLRTVIKFQQSTQLKSSSSKIRQLNKSVFVLQFLQEQYYRELTDTQLKLLSTLR